MNHDVKYQARVYEVGTIIKLVTGLNVDAVRDVARNLLQYYDSEGIDSLDNNVIYESYLNTCEGYDSL